MERRYPGIGIIGSEKVSALYGVDNGIVDWKGTGIQHFFHESFEHDLIHSATTYIHHQESAQIEIGNRLITKTSHPRHQHPMTSSVEDGFCYKTSFESQVQSGLSWTEKVYSTHQNQLVFETTLRNDSSAALSFVAGGYVILRNPKFNNIYCKDDQLVWENHETRLVISGEALDEIDAYLETPTGFVYRTLQQVLAQKTGDDFQAISGETMIGVTTKKKVILLPEQEITIRWMIAASSPNEEIKMNPPYEWSRLYQSAKKDWQSWISTGTIQLDLLPEWIQDHAKTNIIALKASLLNGFVPADLTGHYYSNESPSYYARDALMIAKAFLKAGYFAEAKSIITYAASRATKNNKGEFFQRYDAVGEPSEGANNNVFHQLDSQGYFLSLLEDYFNKTNEWLVPYSDVIKRAEILFECNRKRGLLGPEGGVNEGVFGPAFITSTNMFITGGLLSASRIASIFQDKEHAEKWRSLANSIMSYIENETWINQQARYGYGYVLYADELVEKYDTPQYFGPLYGYPITQQFQRMIEASLENQSFFEYGIGYSEQEYHHGPWLFNTAANAQCQLLIGKKDNYLQMMNWLVQHANAYGLMPEAIDGTSEDVCFINPLTWASAEFISAVATGQKTLVESSGAMPGVKGEVQI